MNHSQRACLLVTALVVGMLGAVLLGLTLDLLPMPALDQTLAAWKRYIQAEPAGFWASVGTGALLCLLALALLRGLFRAGDGSYRYQIEGGEVSVPLALIRQLTEDVLKGYPEVVEAKVRVLGGRRLPRLALDMQVAGRTVFVELGRKLRSRLQAEIQQQTGVELKEITLRMAVTDKKPTMYLPARREAAAVPVTDTAPSPPEEGVIPPPPPPVDLSKIDLDLKPVKGGDTGETAAAEAPEAEGGTAAAGGGDKEAEDGQPSSAQAGFPPPTWRT